MWVDEYMTWKPEDHENLEMISIPSYKTVDSQLGHSQLVSLISTSIPERYKYRFSQLKHIRVVDLVIEPMC